MSEAALRIGVLGTGAWGNRVADLLARGQIAGAKLAWHGGRAALAANTLASTDGVVVAVKPEVQTEIAAGVLFAGKPLFVEKPVGMVQDHWAKLESAAEHHPDLPILVDHVHLWHDGYQGWKEGAGATAWARIRVGGDGPIRTCGALWDWGPHAFAYAVDLCGVGTLTVRDVTVREVKPGQRYYIVALGAIDAAAYPDAMVIAFFGNGLPAKTCRIEWDKAGRWSTFDEVNEEPLPVPPLTRALQTWTDAIAARDAGYDARLGLGRARDVVRLCRQVEVLTGTAR